MYTTKILKIHRSYPLIRSTNGALRGFILMVAGNNEPPSLVGIQSGWGNTNTYQQNKDLPRNLVTQRISKRCSTNHSRERTQTIPLYAVARTCIIRILGSLPQRAEINGINKPRALPRDIAIFPPWASYFSPPVLVLTKLEHKCITADTQLKIP